MSDSSSTSSSDDDVNCEYCGKTVYWYQLERHCKEEHNLYRCNEFGCRKYLKGEEELKIHQEETHHVKQCPRCNVRASPDELKEHQRKAHEDCCLI